MVALSLTELPSSCGHIVLATGGLDKTIHLYSGKRPEKFLHACELKVHADWIRSLDFSLPTCINGEQNVIMLASSSQDKGIRIWKIAQHGSFNNISTKLKTDSNLSSYIEGPMLVADEFSYHVSLESVLIGHEDWVYSVQWQPPLCVSNDVLYSQSPCILSASMDKIMMIWKPDKATGVWMNVVNVGEVTHSALGFYGGHWSPDGKSVLAHGYDGAFHLWNNVGVSDDWKPNIVPSGHFASVTDIAWARLGEYIISVSHDQTTRIFAPLEHGEFADNGLWHEIARPQVHGHDIDCLAVIKEKGHHCFVSGAEEKVARVFEAPLFFLKTLYENTTCKPCLAPDMQNVHALGANLSALGLSQKPIYASDSHQSSCNHKSDLETVQSMPEAVPKVLMEPPTEDQLAYQTLWPESHKLYGHGNELFSLCCDHEGKLLASSCKARTAKEAEILLWQVGTWKIVGRLQAHSLTVTQMEFSHDDNMLLAVSRDRHFSIFTIKRTGSEEVGCVLIAKHEAHRRIIWSCSWNPFSHEFATGSRDKSVKIWAVKNQTCAQPVLTLPQFHSGITAVCWAGAARAPHPAVLVIGMEDGLMEIWDVAHLVEESAGATAAPLLKMDPFLCHVSSVNRICSFYDEGQEQGTLKLASCGADHCVRVFAVRYT